MDLRVVPVGQRRHVGVLVTMLLRHIVPYTGYCLQVISLHLAVYLGMIFRRC